MRLSRAAIPKAEITVSRFAASRIELLEKYSVRSAQRDAAIERFTVEHGRKPTNNEVAVLVRESRADKLAEISTEKLRKQQQTRLLPEEGHALKHLHKESVRACPAVIPPEPSRKQRSRFNTRKSISSNAAPLCVTTS